MLDASGQALVYVYACETREQAAIAKVLTFDAAPSTADIAYILAGAVPGEAVLLDHLTVDLPVSEIPFPAALPLFVTDLGLMSLFGWRGSAGLRLPKSRPDDVRRILKLHGRSAKVGG